ncbi:hypothetical protein DPQ33_08495 [Oceanidesulfovibrio indonesiensis]|uniref:PAS domain-containing protein n=1 Tax=Oceanidesulfovibrio indonesiensis TaxID=54767 RepID=A0A7M3MF78_9BACT|nr:hypothetical protein [Oceanidesulfovibrio indonesiensis]TVM17669.1 hypothetical protein DPQ33_08495 [Oceanidesulfovibrio indonesiensis]
MVAVKQDVVDAFFMMWDLYPEPVMLIHANRDILAVNEAARGLGLDAGLKCHSLYPSDKPCPGCLADLALRSGESRRKAAYAPGQNKFLDGFWIPVAGEEDLYVHFGNDISDYVHPKFMQKKECNC